MNGTCAASTDCRGEPPGGCSAWACLGGICESACFPDAGGFPDATFPDAITFPDAEPAETGVDDRGEPEDAGVDAGELDATSPDATFPDATEPRDADPAEIGPVDTGIPPDSGMAPDAGGCDPTARAPVAGELLINEVLADPGDDLVTGDANNDGTRSAADDEFIELANISASTLDLGNVQFSDMISARHVFPAGTTLSCGQVIVIFGGGSTMNANWQPNWVLASSGGLGLNNTGDALDLGTSAATPEDLINDSYGSNAGNNQSIIRTTELVPGSPFIQHAAHPQANGRTFSPGLRADGTPF